MAGSRLTPTPRLAFGNMTTIGVRCSQHTGPGVGTAEKVVTQEQVAPMCEQLYMPAGLSKGSFRDGVTALRGGVDWVVTLAPYGLVTISQL